MFAAAVAVWVGVLLLEAAAQVINNKRPLTKSGDGRSLPTARGTGASTPLLPRAVLSALSFLLLLRFFIF